MTLALRRSIQATPERTVTVFHQRRQSFREFGDHVARLAGALQALGMKPGDRVGMLGVNSDRWLEVLMGVWWGGGVLNPVNTRWSVPEIVYSLDDCDTGILVVDDHFLSRVEGIRATAQRPPLFIHAGEGLAPEGMPSLQALIDAATPVDDADRDGADLACILYTGGTTGFPKGVMHSHGTLWSIGIQRLAQTPMPGASVALHVAPMFHMGGIGRALVQFIAGETHVLATGFDAARSAAAHRARARHRRVARAHHDAGTHHASRVRLLRPGRACSAWSMVLRPSPSRCSTRAWRCCRRWSSTIPTA